MLSVQGVHDHDGDFTGVLTMLHKDTGTRRPVR